MEETPKLLMQKEACAFIKVSTRTLLRMESKGWLHPLRTLGGHRRYQPDDLIQGDVLRRRYDGRGSFQKTK